MKGLGKEGDDMGLLGENICKFIIIAGSPFAVLFVVECLRRIRERRVDKYLDNIKKPSGEGRPR